MMELKRRYSRQIGGILDPSMRSNPKIGGDPEVFLSLCGQDTKDKNIIRPTYWFLISVLGIKCFFNEQTLRVGDELPMFLFEHAHSATHAVFLRPKTFEKASTA